MENRRSCPPLALLVALLAPGFEACSPGTEAQSPEPKVVDSEPAPPPDAPVSSAPARLDTSTAGVAQRHFQLLREGKLDDLMADYEDDAFLLTPQGLVKGEGALRAHFSAFLEEFDGKGAHLDLGDLRVRDDIAYITWSGESASKKYELGTNTFIIIHGKIVAQSFAGNVATKSKSDDAPESNEAEALPESPVAAVLEHHLKALENGSMEEILEDYTGDSLILTQRGKKMGESGIKGVYEGVLAEFGNPNLKFEVEKKLIEGEVAYVLWSAKGKGDAAGVLTETFLIREGKIASQTVTIGTPGG